MTQADTPGAPVQVFNPEGRDAGIVVGVLGVSIAAFLLLAGPEGWVAAGLLLVPSAIAALRFHRIGLTVSDDEVVVRNLARTHRLRRDEVDRFEFGRGSNVTGQTSVIWVHRGDGKRIEALGTASYSAIKVEEMLARIHAAWPA